MHKSGTHEGIGVGHVSDGDSLWVIYTNEGGMMLIVAEAMWIALKQLGYIDTYQ